MLLGLTCFEGAMERNSIRKVLNYQKARFLQSNDFIKREAFEKSDVLISTPEIISIIGVRRSGKSSLLKIIAQHLLTKKIPEENISFVNFEDTRFLHLSLDDCDFLYETLIENRVSGKMYLFFDEIQALTGWERWLNQLYEFEDVKIFLTGSNSSLLSSQISTLLTGRNRKIFLTPFSFSEFLLFHNISTAKQYLPQTVASIRKNFEMYMKVGGFPEAVKQNDIDILQQYYEDILYRDIIGKNKGIQQQSIIDLASLLATNPGMIAGSTKLSKLLGLKSSNTVRSYLTLLENSFLYYRCDFFSYSKKQQIYNASKYYSVDMALCREVSFHFSDNRGWMLENSVFLELKRRELDVYYWKSSKSREVDFIIKSTENRPAAIQVSYDISNPETKKREITSLLQAAQELNITNLTLITNSHEETILSDSLKIEIVPAWKWMLTR